MSTDLALTRARLLEAALDIFAERGYREATFREICGRAHTNNAAINYHFRDKEGLYLAVIGHAIELSGIDRWHRELDLAAPAAERLRTFVGSVLDGLFGEGRPTIFLKLMARETAEPTPGLDLLMEKVVKPIEQILTSIVRELVGDDVDAATVSEAASSIMAQCVSKHHSHAVQLRLGRDYADPRQRLALIEHVTRFSLGGIEAIRRRARSPAALETSQG